MLTPEQYTIRAKVAAALKAQHEQTPIDADSLRGCLLMAVQMAHHLKLPLKDLQALCSEEQVLWEDYIEMRQRIVAKRKEKR